MSELLTGGCQCGALRYEIRGQVGPLYACHCLECRKQSASAFGLSLTVPRDAFALVRGEPARWTRRADSGGTVDCFFCPACGSRLWHAAPARPEVYTVKGGSLDAPLDLSQAIHIWTSRKLPGLSIPEDARRYPEEPE